MYEIRKEKNNLKAKFVALVENLPDPPCQRLSVGLMKMVFKLIFSYRMIVSFFLKNVPGYIWNHSLSLSQNSMFQNRTIFCVMKLDIYFFNFRYMLSWRNLSGNFTVFSNNRQLIGSCLYSLILVWDLFVRRLSPLIITHQMVLTKRVRRWHLQPL